MARLIAEKLGAGLHTPAYVDNSPGALFIPASGRWFMIPTSVLVTQPLHPDYAVDIRETTPVTEVARGPLILVAHDEVAKAVTAPEIVTQLAAQGVEPVASEPEQWRDVIKHELDRRDK
jgi:hypothetical protein